MAGAPGAPASRYRAATTTPAGDHPPAAPPTPSLTNKWILDHHDGWSRATLSPLFVSLAHGALHPDQFARWLLDRASVARALVTACERVRDMLQARGIDFPALAVAREEAEYLAAYAAQHGLDLESPWRLSYDAGRLVELLDSATDGQGRPPSSAGAASVEGAAGNGAGSVQAAAGVGLSAGGGRRGGGAPPAPVGNAALYCAVTATWAFLCVSWQGCSLSRRHQAISTRGPHETHSELRHFLSRDESLVCIVEVQGVLDSLLNVAASRVDLAKAEKTFEELLSRRVASLDSALEAWQTDGRAPLCEKCARKGHTSDRCTFKSRV